MEYNKNGTQQKNLGKSNTQPDLIIHKRWSNDDNLLVVEFKHGLNSNVSNDKIKLKGFTCQSKEYKYKLGVLVELDSCVSRVRYTYFRLGKKVEKQELEDLQSGQTKI
jgi:hypothetical protein